MSATRLQVMYPGSALTYLAPEGCDFIPEEVMGRPIGICVCTPEWGHNAMEYTRYVRSHEPTS